MFLLKKKFQGDVQKTMATLNLPQKLTLTVPAHLAQSGLQTLVVSLFLVFRNICFRF